jgi:hypothetical protein
MTNARLVILFLGVIVLSSTGGVIYLAASETGIPDVLVALATGGLGALGAVLAKTSNDTPPVIVNNPPPS